RRVPGWMWRLATAGAAWSGLFATLYFTLYRRVATDGYMRQFWAWSFLSPGSPSLVERLPLIARETLFPFFIGSRPHTLAVIVVVAWLAVVAEAAATRRRLAPDVPSLVPLLRRAPPPATPVYVLANALPMWAFYSTDWAAPDTSRLRWLARLAGPGGPAFHNAPARGRPRADEAATLVGHWGARTEIIGLATGMPTRDLAGPAP